MPTFDFNKIVKILIVSDVFIYSAWGLIMPVIAVFIIGPPIGGDASVAGTAVGIYWVVKSLLQVPVGKYLDRNRGEKDDYWFMVIGTFLASLTPVLFLTASEPWHIYGIEVLHAFGMAMVIPSWSGIFTRHIDKGREAETWGFESSSLGLGVGIAGIAGGFIAKAVGFTPLFVAVSFFGLVGVLLLFLIKGSILPKESSVEHEHLRRHRYAQQVRHMKRRGHIH